MAQLLPVGYDLEDYDVAEIAEHYVESRKDFADNEVDYLTELIYSLEYLKTYYEVKDDEPN